MCAGRSAGRTRSRRPAHRPLDQRLAGRVRQRRLVDDLAVAITTARIDPRQVTIEVTESSVIRDARQSTRDARASPCARRLRLDRRLRDRLLVPEPSRRASDRHAQDPEAVRRPPGGDIARRGDRRRHPAARVVARLHRGRRGRRDARSSSSACASSAAASSRGHLFGKAESADDTLPVPPPRAARRAAASSPSSRAAPAATSAALASVRGHVHLQSIRIRGFKSFVEPVELKLEPGVAVVVGPNGSGKSNVADAIVWAAGSLTPSELRAEKPDDVLFGGSSTRQAADHCEVELLFDNERRRLRRGDRLRPDRDHAPPRPRRRGPVPRQQGGRAPHRPRRAARRCRSRRLDALDRLAGEGRRGARVQARGPAPPRRGGRRARQVQAPQASRRAQARPRRDPGRARARTSRRRCASGCARWLSRRRPPSAPRSSRSRSRRSGRGSRSSTSRRSPSAGRTPRRAATRSRSRGGARRRSWPRCSRSGSRPRTSSPTPPGGREAALGALYRLQGASERLALRRESARGPGGAAARGAGRGRAGRGRPQRRGDPRARAARRGAAAAAARDAAAAHGEAAERARLAHARLAAHERRLAAAGRVDARRACGTSGTASRPLSPRRPAARRAPTRGSSHSRPLASASACAARPSPALARALAARARGGARARPPRRPDARGARAARERGGRRQRVPPPPSATTSPSGRARPGSGCRRWSARSRSARAFLRPRSALAAAGETLALSALEAEPGAERAVAAALAWRASAVLASDPARGLELLERARREGLGSLTVVVGGDPAANDGPPVAGRPAAA